MTKKGGWPAWKIDRRPMSTYTDVPSRTGMVRQRRKEPDDVVFRAMKQAIVVISLGGALGALANLIAPWGIPWVRQPYVLSAAADSLLLAGGPPPSRVEKVAEPLSITLAQARMLFERKGAVFIDARPAYEFSEAHIPGSVSIPWEEIEYYEAAIARLPKDSTLVVYCAGLSCDLSIHLGYELARRGFSHVRVFFGGWVEWTQAGLPVEPGRQGTKGGD